MESMDLIRQWVDGGGDSGRNPIMMEIKGRGLKPPSPFKSNVEWLEDESYVDLVKVLWVLWDPLSKNKVGVIFVENLMHTKQSTII